MKKANNLLIIILASKGTRVNFFDIENVYFSFFHTQHVDKRKEDTFW